MVSEWMVNGNISEFVKKQKDTNRFELVGTILPQTHSPLMIIQLQLKGVARGLVYMHGEGMIHGDLKGVGLRKLASPCSPLTLSL